MEILVDQKLLRVFAYLNEGSQFEVNELHCRIVQAQTDEGYPCSGHTLQVYGVPKDPSWHSYMDTMYPGPHDITFYADDWARPQTVDAVTFYIKESLSRRLQAAREEYESIEGLVEPFGV